MIKKSTLFGGKTKVTFSLPVTQPPGDVSVVGDFNGWRPGEHQLRPRRNGTRSVSVVLAPGSYRFRYLATGGVWLDEESGDRTGADCLLRV
jgi:1,4-alpha-glucan branching enzyme